MFGLKTANPQVDRRTGHLQKAADTQLIPALIVQLDHLEAGVIALRMAVIRAERQLALYRSGALLPEPFDGFVINTVVALTLDDPGQLAKLETLIVCFEAGQFFHDFVRYLLAPAGTDNFRVLGKEAEGALLLETPCQLAHRFRVRVGLHGPLDGAPVVKEDDGANHLIAPLDLIDKVEFELGKIRQGVHACGSLLSPL
jgi:hypothetical protein